jgi:hypothetical protein
VGEFEVATSGGIWVAIRGKFVSDAIAEIFINKTVVLLTPWNHVLEQHFFE